MIFVESYVILDALGVLAILIDIFFMCVCVCLFICLSVCLFVCVHACLFVCVVCVCVCVRVHIFDRYCHSYDHILSVFIQQLDTSQTSIFQLVRARHLSSVLTAQCVHKSFPTALKCTSTPSASMAASVCASGRALFAQHSSAPVAS